MTKQNYFFTVAYRGTRFHGWQRQPNAVTVQEEIEEKFSVLLGYKVEILGSGRTDAGVHATGQIFQLALDSEFDLSNLIYRVNKMLSADIVLSDFRKVDRKAHARFDAISRSYEYKISRHKNPFGPDLVYHFNFNLDFDSMNQAAAIMKEYTDFESFSKVKTDVFTFNCKISQAEWKPVIEQVNEEWVFHVSANRFLRGMVRAIVGTLLEVGLGRMSCSEFRQVIEAKERTAAGRAVPAHALYLTQVAYPDTIYR